MTNLSIQNVVNITVSQAGQGAGEYNTSNLAVFTAEPRAVSFGTDGYKIYLDPTEVGVDFGTSSATYEKALSVFSQQPNILAGGGYLVVIPIDSGEQTLEFSGAPDAGSLVLNFKGGSATIAHDDDDAAIQTKLRTIAGLGGVEVSGSFAADIVVDMIGVYGGEGISLGANTLEASTVPVTATITSNDGEKLGVAITRTSTLVEYFGIMCVGELSGADLVAAAAVIQPLNKIAFFGSRDAEILDPDSDFDDIRQAGQFKSRCLYYGRGTSRDLYKFVSAYAGRALSTNFNGSNTTQTMHLKDLVGVLPDSTLTQTRLNKAKDAGVDVYISIQGVPKTFTSGANRFFDDVYNLQWFVGSLQIAGFNVLAQTGTKISQTENGVDSLKSVYREVCERAITNQFVSAGRWTSPNTFGIQEDFFDNISQRGYYIFSLPVALQSAVDRAARKAPLIQMAIKYAGAIHSTDVIVNVNA